MWLPVIMVLTFVLTLGVALFVTAYSFFYEDVRVLLSVVLNALYYILPIIYFSENIFYTGRVRSESMRNLLYHAYLFNPLAWLVTAYKQIFFGVVKISAPDAPVVFSAPFDVRLLLLSTVTIFLILMLGQYNFSRLKWKFTERP